MLTFDDGPIAADVANPAGVADQTQLLAALHQILATLERRNIQAVFYIKGPGDPVAGEVLKPAYTEGLQAIRDAGHVLGYHAYRHTPDIWIEPFAPAAIVSARMSGDLDALVGYLDEVLAPAGLSSDAVFAPLFRPPWGSAGVSTRSAEQAAGARGWTIHGFRINSVDWTTNADSDPITTERLRVAAEQDHVKYVRLCLRAGCIREQGCSVVDVLFHVNSFTAAHLDEWIDELATTDVVRDKALPQFDVPADYLQTSDLALDDRFFTDVLIGR